MTEKRKYPRYLCKIKIKYEILDISESEEASSKQSYKGKGTILDISRGGIFFICNERVRTDMPIKAKFSTKKNKYTAEGRIVRTGLLKNNPSEVAKKFAKYSAKGDAYIAVEFDSPLEDFTEKEVN